LRPLNPKPSLKRPSEVFYLHDYRKGQREVLDSAGQQDGEEGKVDSELMRRKRLNIDLEEFDRMGGKERERFRNLGIYK
jgi:hypothetical protein